MLASAEHLRGHALAFADTMLRLTAAIFESLRPGLKQRIESDDGRECLCC